MMVLGSIFLGFMLFYAAYLLRNAWFFAHLPKGAPVADGPLPSVAVIVPARNEEGRAGLCIADIVAQDYPPDLLEIILVNDHSEDGTVAEALAAGQGHPGFRVVHLEAVQGPAYKKAAVALGIAESKGALLMTTDADCRMGPDWVRSMAAHFSERTGMVSGPVELTGRRIFQELQALEFMGLIAVGSGAIGAGNPTMCNGANLAYRREAFEEAGGFEGIDHIASGDDELLMHKIASQTDWEVAFAKEKKAVVRTRALESLSAFAAQRVRWVSKSRAYERSSITGTLVLSYLAILGLPLLLGLSFWDARAWWFFGASLSLKLLSEGIILSLAAGFFGRLHLLRWLAPEQIAHVAYVLWVGLAGNAGSYFWKGRKVK